MLAFFFVVLALSKARATVITFDALPLNTGTASVIPNGYQGLAWSNFFVVNAVLQIDHYPFLTNGYYYGIVSATNVAGNASGNPAEIDSSTNFNFYGVYLTGAWSSNLNIEVQGFRSGNLVYDQTVVASATNPTPFSFDYMDIDRLYFSASGGQPAFNGAGGSFFAMDNLTIEFIPEPSSLLLTTLGAVTLFAVVRRKRA
jgi:hypothetical protein